jgi:YfiH family protein
MTGDWDWLQEAPLLTAENWRHGWTTSEGPDFGSDPTCADHEKSVTALAQTLGLKECAWARQVHGGRVLEVSENGFAGEADALWTVQPGLGVVGRGADCPLILAGGILPDGSRIWGFAHASWRSTVQGITVGLIQAMTEQGAVKEELRAVICPSAGPCCYEVGEDVRQAALSSLGPEAAWFFLERASGFTFDLWSANLAQLTAAGVLQEHIFNVGHCTICGGDLFPSFRRDGDRAGRFAAVIGY